MTYVLCLSKKKKKWRKKKEKKKDGSNMGGQPPHMAGLEVGVVLATPTAGLKVAEPPLWPLGVAKPLLAEVA